MVDSFSNRDLIEQFIPNTAETDDKIAASGLLNTRKENKDPIN